jgi:hypothetical protein
MFHLLGQSWHEPNQFADLGDLRSYHRRPLVRRLCVSMMEEAARIGAALGMRASTPVSTSIEKGHETGSNPARAARLLLPLTAAALARKAKQNKIHINGVFARDAPIFAPPRLTVSKRIGPPPRRRVCQNAAIRKRPARARIGPPCQKRPA